MSKPFSAQPKYRAKRTKGANGWYASKREAQYAGQLALQQRAGAIVGWLEQVPVRLPGGIRYVIDFLVVLASGGLQFVEVKGVETKEWKLKMALLEQAHPWIWERLVVVK